MSPQPDRPATQRLLDVIRGRFAPGQDHQEGETSTGAASQGFPPVPGEEGLLLSRSLAPRSWLRGRVRVGLDIGTRVAKMVRLERSGHGFRVLQVGLCWDSAEANSESAVRGPKIEAVSALLRDSRGLPVITSVRDPSTLVRQIGFPRMPARELARAMEFEARKHMPYDPRRMLLRYQVLSEDRRGGTCQVLLVAVSKEALEAHRSLLDRLGLEPSAIDVTPLALANSCILAAGDPEETTVVLDLGSSGPVMAIYRRAGMFFSRYLPVAGWEAAEPASGQESTAWEELVVEVRRSLAYYDNLTGRMGFARVLLAGGGAMREGIVGYLQERLGIQVGLLDPAPALQWEDGGPGEEWIRKLAPLWAQAAGQAARY
ncbi:MAG: pilus assembly protein PilM [Thermodesulfobacteriota bacterium]